MRGTVIASLVIAAASAGSVRAAEKPAAASAAENPAVDVTRKVSWDRYAVIPGRNIFLKERPHTFTGNGTPRVTPRPAPPPPPPPPRPTPPPSSGGAAASVLRGVWMIGEQPTAFFENQVTGQVTPVAAGAEFEGGLVKTVTLDAVVYEAGGATRQITIGYALDGSAAAMQVAPTPTSTTGGSAAPATAAAPATGTTGGSSAAATPPASNTDEAALLQKLRERRMRELGK